MINEFKYDPTRKIWPSPLSLSLYSTFKSPADLIRFGWCKFSIMIAILCGFYQKNAAFKNKQAQHNFVGPVNDN